MKIVYHGGMHKTGTKLVQSWLEQNKEELRSFGIQAFTPFSLDSNFTSEEDNLLRNVRTFVDVARANGLERIIISHEGLSSLDTRRLRALNGAVPGAQTHFVLSIRHWNSFLPSRWKQNVRRADSQSFQRMMSRLRAPESSNLTVRFDLILERLIAAEFGKLSLVSYDSALREEGILEAVLRASEIPVLSKSGNVPNWVHPSPDILSCDIIRLFNGIVARREGLSENPLYEVRENTDATIHYFDHDMNTIISNIRIVLPELVQMLSRVTPTVLCASDMSLLEDRLNALAEPYLVNPKSGRLFHDIDDMEIRSSPMELDDFSQVEREMIWLSVNDAVRFARSGQSSLGPVRIR